LSAFKDKSFADGNSRQKSALAIRCKPFQLRLIQEMNTMGKTWFERLFGSAHPSTQTRSSRLRVEELEGRLTPSATFYWTNGNNTNNWEDPKDWTGSRIPTAFPGYDGQNETTDDIANFTGGVQRQDSNCTMHKAHTLASITLGNDPMGRPYTSFLDLVAPLTLSAGYSQMSSGNILQSGNGSITIKGQTNFTWTGGNINPVDSGSARNTFTIEQYAQVSFQQPADGPSAQFGDNLNNSGLLQLSNLNPGIVLVYQPRITNNATGEISMTVSNPSGIKVNAFDPALTISNAGLISKIGTDIGTYGIDNPVTNNATTSAILVKNGTMEFKKADATGYSVNQILGTIQIYSSATLKGDFGLYQGGGKTIGMGTGFSNIDGNVYMVGGILQQGDGTAGNVGILDINGNFNFQGGTLYTFFDTGAANGGLFWVTGAGGVTVNKNATFITVDKIGNGTPPAEMEVMRATAQNAMISDVPPDNNIGGTAGYKHAFRRNSLLGGTNNELWVNMG
jgi:hypothetical protein